MSAVASLTIEVPVDIAEKLGRLAEGSRRDRSTIAGEALAAYVEHELDAIEGIRKGLDDVAAGRVVPHDDAMAEVYAIIEAARGRRA